KIKDYDFYSPKKFTKEQLRTMDSLHENLARLFSSYFSGVLRLFCEVSILQIEEQRYYEFNNALPDTALLGLIDLKPKMPNLNEATLMIDVSQNICFFMIDRLLGGSGAGNNFARDFTDIELPILKSVYAKLTTYIQESWKDYIDVSAELNSIETNPRLIQVYAPEDIVVIVALKVKFKDLEGTISICIPAIGLEEMLGDFTSKYMRISKKLSDENRETTRKNVIKDSVYESKLELKVVFDQTHLDLAEIMNLRIDDVIPLNKKLNSNIAIEVNDVPWFTASLGNVKNKKAVKVKGVYNQ
ncbi:MAG: flagellar motor switch protein FliM, partial [Hydrogenoanaerobacterium sp.]